MSESAVVQLGYDDSAVKAGLARTAREMTSTRAKVEKSLTIKPGAGMRGIGGAAMQVQDIAVQLQAGTSAITVLSQQGSQMASVFGPAGMIVGGVVALGGALYTAGTAGREAFAELLKGSDAVAESIGGLVKGGSIDQLSGALGEVKNQLKAIAEERAKINEFFAFAKYAPQMAVGGPGFTGRSNALDDAEMKLEEGGMKARLAIFKASQKEVELLRLKAQGRTEEADVMERQIALAKELAGIAASDLPEGLKRSLELHAKERAEWSYQLAQSQKKLAADEKLKQEAKQQAKAMDDRKAIAMDLQVMAAKAAGDTAKADALEKELKLHQRIQALVAGGAVNADEARQIAETEQELQDKINGVVSQKGGRIKGGNEAKRQAALAKMRAGGLDELERLNVGSRGERRNGAFGAAVTLDQRLNPFFKMPGPLNARNAANAQRAAAVNIGRAPALEAKLDTLINKLNIAQ